MLFSCIRILQQNYKLISFIIICEKNQFLNFREINLELIKAKYIKKLNFTWSNVLSYFINNDYKIYFDNILNKSLLIRFIRLVIKLTIKMKSICLYIILY